MSVKFPTNTAADRERTVKWDRRFIDLMNVVGSWSKDPSTKVGAVIVRPDLTVASIGYNGFPRGIKDDLRLEDRPTKYSLIVHGEINAILNAHGPVRGCTLYVPFPPCDRCAVQVVQAGIARVVYVEPTADIESRWGDAFVKTNAIFKEAGVEVTVLPALPEEPVVVQRDLPDAGSNARTLQIDVSVSSVDGQQVCHGRHLVDEMVIDRRGNDLSSDEARMALVSHVIKASVEAAVTNHHRRRVL